MSVMIGMLAILMLLGFFIDQTSIMMITLPFYMPLLRAWASIWSGSASFICFACRSGC